MLDKSTCLVKSKYQALNHSVTLDTICAGLMGYNYTLIPTLGNCLLEKNEDIDIIGDKPKLTHIFDFAQIGQIMPKD